MSSKKLTNVLKIITDNLAQEQIPYSLIGALALSLYGLPRFTADIDFVTEGRFWSMISLIMEKLGYTCYQKTRSFAQFDSEMGVLGKIDFMFVDTPEGKDILERSMLASDELIGTYPVIQPTDYIILKLMAIANNPDRSQKDEGDIVAVMNLYKNRLIPENLEPLDRDKVYFFAKKFGQKEKAQRYFDKVFGASDKSGKLGL
jgi:predicted nucleotidyltransferase